MQNVLHRLQLQKFIKIERLFNDDPFLNEFICFLDNKLSLAQNRNAFFQDFCFHSVSLRIKKISKFMNVRVLFWYKN